MKKETKTDHCNIVVNQTQCPPAVRMFFLQVWISEDDPERKVHRKHYPVLALRTEYVQCFCHSSHEGSYMIGEPTAEILMDSGWRFRGNETRIHAVILDEEYGLIDSDDPLMDACDEISRLVELPWPYDSEADLERLGAIFGEMEEEAMRRLSSMATAQQAKEGFQKMREACE